MDPEVIAATARWPNVPACYGWLALDARGRWRIGEGGGELVQHAGLVAFLGRNYGATAAGEWYVQNGPQRVFVRLERAPYVVRLAAPGLWQTHNGLAVRQVLAALVDAAGHVYVVCEHGLAGLDDRDLVGALVPPDGDAAPPEAVAIAIGGARVPLASVEAGTLPARYGFVREPRAPA